jgi:hypothetical protein
MHTVQHPFFLSSSQGSNRSADGSSFEVRLNPPLRIPRAAKHTRVYCNQASAVYSFPNVTSAANTLRLRMETIEHTLLDYVLTIPPGLYANLDDLTAALSASAVNQGLPANFVGTNLTLAANLATSRVTLTINDQFVSVVLEPDSTCLLSNMLGFSTTQTHAGLLTPQQKGWSFHARFSSVYNPTGISTTTSRIQFVWTANGVQNTQEVFVPSHMYTIEGFRTAINEELAAGRTNAALPAIPGGTNLRVASISPTSLTQLNVVMNDSSVTASFPQTDVSYSDTGDVKVYEALNPASFDKVRSLQISCPGLAAGVHINSEAGSSTIARFPINTSPGGLIQHNPINPIKNSRDMSGENITNFRVELQDQLARPIETAGEEYHVVLIIEYELDTGTKVSGGVQ